MNKKGVAITKMVIFLIGSLIVSATVIFAFLNIVPTLMKNTEEQITAKDIGLTIMTVSASPNNMIYRYDKNTENYEVRINQDEVQVKSKDGSGKYKYIQMIGIAVDDALIQNKLMIPIMLNNGKLFFGDDKMSYEDVCSVIPPNFDGDEIKVKIEIHFGESSDSEKKLDEIKAIIAMYATHANSKSEFVESNEDLRIILQTGSAPEIKYYENMEDQTASLYHRIACYINSGINSEEKLKTTIGSSTLSSSSDESITINFGDTNKFVEELNKDPQLSARIAKGIYSSIELGITE